VTKSWWQHHKHCHSYYYYLLVFLDLTCYNDPHCCAWPAEICIVPIVRSSHLKRSGMDHTVFYAATTPHLPLPRRLVKHSPDGATTDSDNSCLIGGYYSFIELREDERLSLPSRLAYYSGRFTYCGQSSINKQTNRRPRTWEAHLWSVQAWITSYLPSPLLPVVVLTDWWRWWWWYWCVDVGTWWILKCQRRVPHMLSGSRTRRKCLLKIW